MENAKWTEACAQSVKKYNEQLLEHVDAGKPLNVYEYLNWLNESDPTVMEYLPKRC